MRYFFFSFLVILASSRSSISEFSRGGSRAESYLLQGHRACGRQKEKPAGVIPCGFLSALHPLWVSPPWVLVPKGCKDILYSGADGETRTRTAFATTPSR